MNILVTGAGGFLGSALCAHWQRAGHHVQGTFRSAARAAAAPASLGARHVLPLGAVPSPGLLAGCHAVVHAAYDAAPAPDRLRRNVAGTLAVAEAARRAGVPRQVYISSYSAHPQGTSDYAQVKVLLEAYFRRLGAPSLRPALIVGDGGLCGRMLRMVRRLPCVPLLDGGRGPVAVVALGDVAQALDRLLTGELPAGPSDGAYNLACPEEPTMRQLLLRMGVAMDRRVRFAPIPLAPMVTLAQACERLRLPLPVSSENLRGYRLNRAQSRRSHHEILGVQPLGVDAMLAACVV